MFNETSGHNGQRTCILTSQPISLPFCLSAEITPLKSSTFAPVSTPTSQTGCQRISCVVPSHVFKEHQEQSQPLSPLSNRVKRSFSSKPLMAFILQSFYS